MRITDLLKKQGISLGVSPSGKKDAIDKLVALHDKCGNGDESPQFQATNTG